MPFEEGPYVQMAAFCEQVIEEKTGIASIIRIIDTLTQSATGPEVPEEMPPLTRSMKLVLILKSGRVEGRHEISIMPQSPLGETKQPFVRSIQLEGEERGVRLTLNIVYTFEYEGVYWFHILFDDVLITKIPFRVKYERIITGPPTPRSR